MSIRDTSAQDRRVAPPSGVRRHRTRLIATGVGAAMIMLSAWLVVGWSAGGRSVDASRLRIAEVSRGDLVRDLRADGRVIAANSPTLYAIASGTVTLKVVAGDAVEKGQALAEIDSPELRSRLAQEQATLASFEAEASRAGLNAQVTRSQSRRALDQAEIDRTAALRDLERHQRGFDGGAVAQIDVAHAQDQLKKAELALAHAGREHALQGQGRASTPATNACSPTASTPSSPKSSARSMRSLCVRPSTVRSAKCRSCNAPMSLPTRRC